MIWDRSPRRLCAGASCAGERYHEKVLLGLLAAGLFILMLSRKAWYMRSGWRFKDAEPSELALVVGRVSGAVVVVAASALCLSAL